MSSEDSSLTDSAGEEVPVKKAKVQEQKKDKTLKKDNEKKKVAKRVEISDDDDDESDSDKGKKGKNAGKKAKELSDSSGDEQFEEEEASTKKKTNRERDQQGNEMIPIGNNRFVAVDRFKGKILVSIREHYQKDGKWLPGKKGISLTLDQYNAFKKLLPEIKEMIDSA